MKKNVSLFFIVVLALLYNQVYALLYSPFFRPKKSNLRWIGLVSFLFVQKFSWNKNRK